MLRTLIKPQGTLTPTLCQREREFRLITFAPSRIVCSIMVFTVFTSLVGQSAAGEPQVAPFGSWKSPISAQMLVQGAVRFGDVSIDGDTVYWVEGRPQEAGRY